MDYRAAGHYFVTLCTKNRERFFGDVVDGKMVLSSIGKIAATEWLSIPTRRRDIELDEWVVMPNHLHAIVVLDGDVSVGSVETPQCYRNGISLSNEPPLADRGQPEPIQRGVSTAPRLLAGSLGAVIGQFKSRATKRIWRAGSLEFAWQERFYDHIIRDDRSLNDIRQYIIDNPLKWELEQDNVENLYM